MSKILKIKVNDNLNSIYNFINSKNDKISWYELIQWCIDYDCYKELYSNHFLINHVLEEHNLQEFNSDLYIKELERNL